VKELRALCQELKKANELLTSGSHQERLSDGLSNAQALSEVRTSPTTVPQMEHAHLMEAVNIPLANTANGPTYFETLPPTSNFGFLQTLDPSQQSVLHQTVIQSEQTPRDSSQHSLGANGRPLFTGFSALPVHGQPSQSMFNSSEVQGDLLPGRIYSSDDFSVDVLPRHQPSSNSSK
jgi:hypothetical protein